MMNDLRKAIAFFLFVALALPGFSSPDTLRLDMPACERIFLEKNLELLIAKTNIDETKGLLLQSKLFDNPEVELNRQLYNFETKKFLPHNESTQFDLQVTQLITTAGKHWKEIAINKDKVKLSEVEFYNVLRGLKYELRENFLELVSDQRKLAVLHDGMEELQKLIDALTYQVEKGNVARKELVRLNAQMLEFQEDRREVLDKILENEADLKMLLSMRGNEYVIALPEEKDLVQPVGTLLFDSLEATAFANRQDLIEARLAQEIGRKEVQLARMNAAPDLRLGMQYDRAGTGGDQYTGLLVGVPLPLFNHNEGNIKSAKAEYEQTKLELQQREIEVHNNLMEEYGQLLNARDLYQKAQKNVSGSFDEIYRNIYDSYKTRTIGIIEFLEYFDSYRNTKFNLIEIETSLRLQAQKLNFELGKDLL